MTEDIVNKTWDVIVVGTGMGGGTIGRRLAEKGLSVLYLERGPEGPRGEEQSIDNGHHHDPAVRLTRGYWPKPMRADINGKSSEFFGPLGAGIGGTSVFYAATLERPEIHDLQDSTERPHPTGGWPANYNSFQPYFEDAERMFQVSGDGDPLTSVSASALKTPPPLSEVDTILMNTFRNKGLHPYRMHMGIKGLSDCRHCIGRKCPKTCKMDARSAGVEPAKATGRAAVLDYCQVIAFRGNREQITHIEARHRGTILNLKARRYILSAGALGSPRLLLASAAEHWPQGCANSSGLVGRNLMFHLNETIAIWPNRSVNSDGPSKAIALRDFYYRNGQRLGSFQAMGLDASYGNIVHYLNNVFDRSVMRDVKPLRQFTRVPAFIAARLLGNAKIFVGIIEDPPDEQNRVTLDENDPEIIRFRYDIGPELLARRHLFRRVVKKALRGQRFFFMNTAPELNFGHPCGTVRFGADPATSVLDTSCRTHDVKNLYVVDSSFMPTSCAVNPSLTIAANALRVADSLIADLSR